MPSSDETTHLDGKQGWREQLRVRAAAAEARRAWERANPEEARRQREAAREAGRAEHEKRQAEEMDAFLERCGVEERERDLLMAGPLSPTWGQVQARDEGGKPVGQPFSAVTEARAFWRSPAETFLLFVGERGTGKTVAAAELCTYCRFGYQHPDLGAVWCWPHAISDAPLFRVASRLARMPTFGTEAEREKAQLRSCRLLVVDELGTELMTDPWLSLLQELVNDRYRAKRRTVLVANLTKRDFAKRYGSRVARRVEEAGRIVDLGNQRLSGGARHA